MLPVARTSAPVQSSESSSAGPAAVMPSGPRPTIYELFGGVQRKAAGAEADAAAIHASSQRGIATPAPESNPRTTQQMLAPRDAGAPLPEPVREKMEGAFGTEFGDVRVHEGEQAPSVGAIAYTSGSHVHFAPGRYDPDRPSGQELLGHELAHVVQQRAGRVAVPQGYGAPVNAEHGLEAEADAAGARAARGEAVGGAAGARRAAAAGDVIQRAVGFEFELQWWSSQTEDGNALKKKDDIIDRTDEGFRVEADDAPGGGSDVEFVVLPSDTPEEAHAAVDAAAGLAAQLATRAGETVTAAEYGGEKGVEMGVSDSTDAIVQVTAAVPLERISALFDEVDDLNARTLTLQGGKARETKQAVETFEQQRIEKGNDPLRPKLKGFLIILANYLKLGAQKSVVKWPKSIFPIMARTTFTKMMSLLDEDDKQWIVENLDNWVQFVLAAAGMGEGLPAAEQPVIAAVFNDLEPGKYHKLTTTREEWLTEMPQNDHLSRGHDSWFEGMGEYGEKTDERIPPEMAELTSNVASVMAPELTKIVGEYDGEEEESEEEATLIKNSKLELGGLSSKDDSSKDDPSAEAPLFELRALGEQKINKWVDTADAAFKQIDDALGRVRYKGPGWQPKKKSAQAQADGPPPHDPDSGDFEETENPRAQPLVRPSNVEPRVSDATEQEVEGKEKGKGKKKKQKKDRDKRCIMM
jgi:hypothetical protein